MKPINLFYEEPDPDRWFKYDRYLRKIIRRIIRGKSRPGGQMMVAINLMRGLDILGVPYRFNDYAYAKKNPQELIGVIGKSHLIFENRFKNPILFGASVFSHPIDYALLFSQFPQIKKILVPGIWIKKKFDEYYGAEQVIAWPTGIDTHTWNKNIKADKPKVDFLIYDKVRWERDKYVSQLVTPIQEMLSHLGYSFDVIKYGAYEPPVLKEKVSNCKAMIFLCEHETQGIAYQQVLATNTPILAWDRGGFWQDPEYYPHRVQFSPVTSVPYWNEKCGETFKGMEDFKEKLEVFIEQLDNYQPDAYIINNLTLEKCAQEYINIYRCLM